MMVRREMIPLFPRSRGAPGHETLIGKANHEASSPGFR
jgi:hypothetical protein